MIVDKNAKSLEESVYLKLEEEILNGTLKPGDMLAEISLSKRLGVSRTPVRAALHRLSEEGLTRSEPNRGSEVVGVSSEDLIDIYKIRIRLEGLASAEAAERIGKEELMRLRESVELSEFYLEKRDTEHLKELDSEFHSIIYAASGNRHLNKILSELHRSIKTYRKLSLTVPQRLELSVKEHREILAAIEQRDSELAEKLTAQHVDAALKNLISIVKER